MSARQMSPTAWGLLIALALLWAGSFFFVEVAVRRMPPIVVVTCRVLLGAVALYGYVRVRGIAMPADARIWGMLVVMGALNNALPFTLIAWAQSGIESGVAAILNATTPLFTVLLAHMLTRDERLTRNRAVGVVVGFLGVALLIGPGALGGLRADSLHQLAVLAAACFYGLAGLYGRRLKGLDPAVAATGMLAGSTLMMTPLALASGIGSLQAITLELAAALIGLGTLSTALAYVLYFRILALAGATNLLLVTFLIPPGAILLGAAFLGERPLLSALAGMVVIFLGLALIDGRLVRRVWPGRAASKGP